MQQLPKRSREYSSVFVQSNTFFVTGDSLNVETRFFLVVFVLNCVPMFMVIWSSFLNLRLFLQRIESRATLVVAPQAIIQQWKTEIKKSAENITVYEYEGIAKSGFVSPWLLSRADIVLASYEMLSGEILYLHAEARKAS